MSNGARAGLTGFVAGLARQVARYNVTINNLLPGPFLTDRYRSLAAAEARRQNVTVKASSNRFCPTIKPEEAAQRNAQAAPNSSGSPDPARRGRLALPRQRLLDRDVPTARLRAGHR